MCSAGMRSADSITVLFEGGFNRSVHSSDLLVARLVASESVRSQATEPARRRPRRPRRPCVPVCTLRPNEARPREPAPAQWPPGRGTRAGVSESDGPELRTHWQPRHHCWQAPQWGQVRRPRASGSASRGRILPVLVEFRARPSRYHPTLTRRALRPARGLGPSA